jgi:2-phosphosulfolactate phosphatase
VVKSIASERVIAIDFLPESARRFGPGWAVVAIDILRATTTAVTIGNTGRRCMPAPNVAAALKLAERHPDALLVGEVGGELPERFHLQNSPVAMERRRDVERPAILVSSSGTRIFHEAAFAGAVYAACLRNARAQAEHLIANHERVALIGAGTKGEFRSEDQFGCARIAAPLTAAGYAAADEATRQVVSRWRNAPVELCARGPSADYLRRTGQTDDLEFVLARLDDVATVFRFEREELVKVDP